MTSEETVIAVAPQMNHDAAIRTTWDLIFTDRRLIAVKIGRGSDISAAVFGVIGTIVADRSSREKSEALRELSLSEILASGDDKEFFDYAALESIIVRPKRILSSGVAIKPRGKKKKKYWGKYRNVIDLFKASNVLRQYGAPVR